MVEAFTDCARELLDGLAEESSWDAVIAAEPGLAKALAGDRLDAALEAVADFGDLKSPWFTGHSRGVARLAAAAAQEAGLPADAVTELRRAALVHDLGRTGVPNTIWDKPGPLTDAERERVRLHPYYTERMLARPEALARLGAIAAGHHERLDGSGYHRSLPGSALSPSARILAAADVYHAMTEARPHREALAADAAAAELRGEVRAGRIDADAAEDVLGRRRSPARRALRERARPAGLTARELEVLLLVARGASSRDVARQLVIAEKTARNHIEHIYTKLGGLHPRGGIALRDAPRARRLTARSWGECPMTGRGPARTLRAMLQLDRSPRDTRPSDGRGLGPLGRLGRWAATHRRTVVLAWVVVAVVLGVLAPRAEHALSGGGWQADGSESVEARRLIDRHFDGQGSYALLAVVSSRTHDSASPAFRATVGRVAGLLRRDPAVGAVRRPGRVDRAERAGGRRARRRGRRHRRDGARRESPARSARGGGRTGNRGVAHRLRRVCGRSSTRRTRPRCCAPRCSPGRSRWPCSPSPSARSPRPGSRWSSRSWDWWPPPARSGSAHSSPASRSGR